MNVSTPTHHLSVADYLELESLGEVRHEFLCGSAYARTTGSEAHNIITLNIASAFHAHLRGGPCRAYMTDFKVRLQVEREDVFYYPDVMVACIREGVEKYFLRYPKLIVEVLSPSTEATDRREKTLNYPHISTLEEYVIVAQEQREITLHRRDDGWQPIVVARAGAAVEFRSIKLSLSLDQVYENVSFD